MTATAVYRQELSMPKRAIFLPVTGRIRIAPLLCRMQAAVPPF